MPTQNAQTLETAIDIARDTLRKLMGFIDDEYVSECNLRLYKLFLWAKRKERRIYREMVRRVTKQAMFALIRQKAKQGELKGGEWWDKVAAKPVIVTSNPIVYDYLMGKTLKE